MTENDIHLYLPEIVDTMNDGLFLVRPDGKLLMVNEALCAITGYDRNELLSGSCSIFDCEVCRDARDHSGQHWCRLFDHRGLSKKDCHLRRKDGTFVHVLKSASILRDTNGKVIAAVETVTDITELDRKESRIRELTSLLGEDHFHGMIGRSPAMLRVYDLLERAAQSDAQVIIYGESGTGKEPAAQAIHALGPRKSGPFVQLNCAALNESLLESELFGHVKGAFTGAHKHRVGRFEEASGGDIFLDEIGDVPESIQVKLLRVLETKRFERVGDNTPQQMNARIITATNRNLPEMVQQNLFRGDFFYRINVIPIHLPPLRERDGDIPLLANHFIRQLNLTHGKNIEGLDSDAMSIFNAYKWPGNVRELRSALEYSFVVCDDKRIRKTHIPEHISVNKTADCNFPASTQKLKNTQKRSIEAQELIDALQKCDGNKSKAAKMLKVSRVTILNRMRKHGIATENIVTSTE